MEYCANLELNGVETWRLPTFEKISEVDFSKFKHTINDGSYLTNDFEFLNLEKYNTYMKTYFSPFVRATVYSISSSYQGRVSTF